MNQTGGDMIAAFDSAHSRVAVLNDLLLVVELREDDLVVDPAGEIEQDDGHQSEDHEIDDILGEHAGPRSGHHSTEHDRQAEVVAGDGEGHGEVVILEELCPQDEAAVQRVVHPLADDNKDEDDGQVR